MTPNEIAEHLRKEAEKHGASISDLSFTTAYGKTCGLHSYRGVRHQTMSDPQGVTIYLTADE